MNHGAVGESGLPETCVVHMQFEISDRRQSGGPEAACFVANRRCSWGVWPGLAGPLLPLPRPDWNTGGPCLGQSGIVN